MIGRNALKNDEAAFSAVDSSILVDSLVISINAISLRGKVLELCEKCLVRR